MPLYEFQCDACKNRFERIQKFTDPNPEICPKCGKGPVRKLPSSPAIQFKGSGFYITDYAKKSSSEASSGEVEQRQRRLDVIVRRLEVGIEVRLEIRIQVGVEVHRDQVRRRARRPTRKASFESAS